MFLCWSLVNSIYRYNYRDNLFTLYNVFFGVLLYWIITKLIKKEHINKILNIICIATLLQVVWAGLQFYRIYWPLNLEAGLDKIVCGWIGNQNLFSIFLAISIPAFFRKKWIYLLPIVLLPLIQHSHTKGGVISLILGIIFYLAYAKYPLKQKIVIGIATASLIVFYLAQSHTMINVLKNNTRYQAWNKIYYISNHVQIYSANIHMRILPDIQWKDSIIGYGLGQFAAISRPISELLYYDVGDLKIYSQAHNDFLQIKLELGWIGVSIVLGCIGSIVIAFRRMAKSPHVIIISTGIFIIFISSFGSFPWHHPCLIWLMITYFAMFEVIRKKRRKKINEEISERIN